MKRILHIEDSATAQTIVRRILGPAHELTVAISPKTAEALLDQNKYDLVITDFHFPRCDAFEIIAPLRQAHPALELPIIAVSGSMDLALMTRLLKAGVNACLAKPINPPEFLALVEQMLKEPYVEHYQNAVSAVSSFQWFERGVYHEFCPEISAHVTGADRDELAEKIQKLLQEFARKGAPLGFTNQERVQCYTVEHAGTTQAKPLLQPALEINSEPD